MENVTTEFLAAFVPFTLNVGIAAPGGNAVTVHVYVNAAEILFPLVPTSAPRTVRFPVVPVTGFGVMLAAVITVGVSLGVTADPRGVYTLLLAKTPDALIVCMRAKYVDSGNTLFVAVAVAVGFVGFGLT